MKVRFEKRVKTRRTVKSILLHGSETRTQIHGENIMIAVKDGLERRLETAQGQQGSL